MNVPTIEDVQEMAVERFHLTEITESYPVYANKNKTILLSYHYIGIRNGEQVEVGIDLDDREFAVWERKLTNKEWLFLEAVPRGEQA